MLSGMQSVSKTPASSSRLGGAAKRLKRLRKQAAAKTPRHEPSTHAAKDPEQRRRVEL